MEVVIYGIVFILILAIITMGYKQKRMESATKIVIYLMLVATIISLLLQKGIHPFLQSLGLRNIDCQLLAAILIFLLSIMIAYHNRKNSSLSKISILLAGLFVTIVTLVYPLYDEYGDTFQRAIYSILYSVQCIYVGQDFEFIQTKIAAHQAATFYSFYMNIMFLLAPVFTTGVIITLLESFMHKLKCIFAFCKPWKKEVYVFSYINKESVTLAETLYYPSAILIFCNEKESEIKESLKIRIRKLQGITLDNSELELTVGRRKTNFYEISNDEIKNMDNAMKLMEKYSAREDVKVTVFSTRKEAEMLLDSTNRKMQVALVNKNRYALYHLFEQSPMIQWSKNHFSSVLLMGDQDRVLEMIKMTLWSMQLDGEELEIHVIDEKASTLQSMFYHQCPGLKEEKYHVYFHQANIETEELDEAIDNYCQNVNYIILAMKEDQLNVETAIYLREHYLFLDKEHYNNQPPIHIWLNDEIKGIDELGINESNYAIPGSDNKKIPYQFYPFGTTEQIYSEVSILNTKLEKFALMMHLANLGVLTKPSEVQKTAKQIYRNRENTRKYAITCAIHMKYSLYTKGIDLFHQELTKELIDKLKEKMEQEEVVQSLMRSDIRMWNTFWRTEGFRRISFEEASVYCNVITKTHQHAIAKLNPCLTDLEEFEENERQLEKIRGRKVKLILVERNYVKSFPTILENVLEEEKKW